MSYSEPVNQRHRAAPRKAPRDADAALARAAFDAAVRAARPEPVVEDAVSKVTLPPNGRIFILALGKAALPMARAAVQSLVRREREPAGGLAVVPEGGDAPHPAVEVVVGDHPVPGARSAHAAERVGALAAEAESGDLVLVLLSGGATSLAAAPIAGIEPAEFVALHELLLASGLDIVTMNAVRKRVSRWGAGRLALALAPARTRRVIVSDVIGGDLATVASGPCEPDPRSAWEVMSLLRTAGLWTRIPEGVRAHLSGVARGELPETPKPDAPVFASREAPTVLDNAAALRAAVSTAWRLGAGDVHAVPEPLCGEAAEVGGEVARTILGWREPRADGPLCIVWGGEATVTLGDASGVGGRCQELALAAARALHDAGSAGAGVTILAAGTDGRDGPTDAAGAIVHGGTWRAIGVAGLDPEVSLQRHDAHHALDAVGALVRTGLTGTNVMDVVIGVRG